MELDQNVLFQIATSLEYEDLLRFCSSSKRFNRLICQHPGIWRYRLEKDFPDWKDHIKDGGLRQIYRLLIGLTKLKRIFKYKDTIYQLIKEKKLDLSNNQISVIPPEIGNLINLEVLYLYNNQISIIPPEIGNLINLQYLYLYDNQILVIPPEIGNLTNLRGLYLSYNQISVIPPEIGNLTNLRVLYLDKNQISVIPPEIGNLTNLQRLYLDKGVKNIPDKLRSKVTFK